MPRSICKHVSLFLFAALTISSPAVFAQTGTTSLHGTVLDKSRAAVAGAKVTLTSPALGLQRGTTTLSTGEFEFLALPPGNYLLMIERQGLAGTSRPVCNCWSTTQLPST